MLVDNVFWGSLDTYTATPGELAVTIPLARLGLHVVEIRNRPERNTAAVPVSATSFKLEFKQLETAYDGHAIDYTYDDLSRLLAADYFAAWDDVNPVRDYTFAYDVAGNRTSEVVNVDGSPFSSQSHTYDAANRISSAGFAYNDAGQMTADGTLSYSWDRAGRLLDAGDSSYAYNGLGQRVQQTVSGVVTDYLLDTQPGLAKVIAATTGANTERFVHERGLLSQQDSAGDWQWMVADGLGSVRGVVDGAGFDPAYSVHYAPYGQPWGEQGPEQTPFGFTGEPTDDNGLVNLRARYYNPALGVFPSLDPIEGVLQQVMSLNRYAYVAGNVVNAVDPSGLKPSCQELPCPSRFYLPETNFRPTPPEQGYIDEGTIPLIGGLLLAIEHGEDALNEFLGLDGTPFALDFNPLDLIPGLGIFTRYTIRTIMLLAAERAEAVGNDDAARNLRHFLTGSGDMSDYPVEKMLRELPLWHIDIADYLFSSVQSLINPNNQQNAAMFRVQDDTYPAHCRAYWYSTRWRRVGQGSNVTAGHPNWGSDIYSTGFDLSIGSRDFSNMYRDNLDGSYTREEFDWYLAMNAFNYWISEGVVVDDSRDTVHICFRIHVEDRYAWYVNEGTGSVDRIMAGVDISGIGQNYGIRGRSTERCVHFTIPQAFGDLDSDEDNNFSAFASSIILFE